MILIFIIEYLWRFIIINRSKYLKMMDFLAKKAQNIGNNIIDMGQYFEKETNMVMFRGKITVSPNTLNNEIHTYFFSQYWQQRYTQELFAQQNNQKLKLKGQSDKKQPPKQYKYSYKNWMKLIENVSYFNRDYVQFFNKDIKQKPPINIMDFRAFRLFHDWDVWGDSTSYSEIKATACFDSQEANPLKIIQKDLYLTTKMGTNKCIVANQDTDSQGTSKLFGYTLNMNQQLKLNTNPSTTRQIHFRTVDTLPWTPSMGVHWFANGKIQLLHGGVNPKEIDPVLKKLLPSGVLQSWGALQSWVQLRMLQYRYNHPTKLSSLVGYLMKIDKNENQQLSFITKHWRIVNCEAVYSNPGPDQTFNKNTNNHTNIQVFIKSIKFGKGNQKKYGLLVDISAAVMDANNQQLLPLIPYEFEITIKTLDFTTNKQLDTFNAVYQYQRLQQIFHKYGGLIILQTKNGEKIKNGKYLVHIRQKLNSKLYKSIIEVQFKSSKLIPSNGCIQSQYNIEIRDQFKKTKAIQLNRQIQEKEEQATIDDKHLQNNGKFQTFVTFDVYLTTYGQPFSGAKQITLSSEYEIDSSGLTQYTTNPIYLQAKSIDQPRKRIQRLLDASPQFRNKYKSFENIDQQVYLGMLEKQIIPETNRYVDKLLVKQGENKGKLRYTFPSLNTIRQFKLSFQQNKQIFKKQIKFVKGHAKIRVYLNHNLTKINNPRHPALESLCLVGTFQIPNKGQSIQKTFTALFFQNAAQDPYYKIDWLHVVGPKLKHMGLMYPAMQNIVNLYDYDGLSMNSMKRAFEIQDQNHSRYMPATRQMSSVTHRQIRRWLYNPVYDAKVHLQQFIDNHNDKQKFDTQSGKLFSIKKYFDKKKEELIQLLKQAFKLELTTIPLYLSALYSVDAQGQASKLIRSVAKDQMKHLAIVSNILNAIGADPPYPLPKQTSSKYIPTFPLDVQDKQNGLICFHFQDLPRNQYWKDLMKMIEIKSSIEEQLLRFIIIQMPSQAYSIKITPKLLYRNKNNILQQLSLNQDAKYPDPKLYKTASRINLVRSAIQAISYELLKKSNDQRDHKKNDFLTIGMAYEKIMDAFWELNDINSKQLFNGDKSRQFTYLYLSNMTEVINLRTAMEQMREIIVEGQGSSLFSATGQLNQKSHFLKFIEIFTGCDISVKPIYKKVETKQQKYFRRYAEFNFIPNYDRFKNFPDYTKVQWSEKTNEDVDKLVNSQLPLERLSDRLKFTKFPNTYAPLSFVNGYKKILEELGFIFRTHPKLYEEQNKESFADARLRSMQNTIAKMRQMSLNATHIVNPNDTFDQSKKYDSAGPKYNIQESTYLPRPIDPENPTPVNKK